MKLAITIFLLALIAISVQTYFLNGEPHSEEAVCFGALITIDILLLLIYVFDNENILYRRVIGALLVCCIIISNIFYLLFLYVMELGKAFRN
ncbi:hypothetical protein C4F50_04735 [Flavobacterium sp. KB82]|uniref:Uncharacterized protein n=1 Tax=Flavobacterium hungaricum TaxID=2082725 RepID=A0ABR9TFW2_9FLAO|nr:hypothetical protein [Flavobacterium hungaricum]